MNRYIVNFARTPSADELGSVTDSDKVKVLDTSHEMVLLEGDHEEVEKLAAAIPDATVIPEQRFAIGPEQAKTRLKLRR